MTQQFLRISIGLLLPLLLIQTPAFAELQGVQRKSVLNATYKTCVSSAAKSSPQAMQSEKENWCKCYSTQVVDNIAPDDVKGFSTTSGPSTNMVRVANEAIAYCKRKLY